MAVPLSTTLLPHPGPTTGPILTILPRLTYGEILRTRTDLPGELNKKINFNIDCSVLSPLFWF